MPSAAGFGVHPVEGVYTGGGWLINVKHFDKNVKDNHLVRVVLHAL